MKKERLFCNHNLAGILASLLLGVASLTAGAQTADEGAANPMVKLTTSMGDITLELYPEQAPLTVANFLGYVNDGFYDGTIFHRVIPAFMIQGGGYGPGMAQKTEGPGIQNEANNGLKNVEGTVAMARTSDPHSAAAQFFINTADNDFLDHTAETDQGWGYTVFGQVVEGLSIAAQISLVQTGTIGMHGDVPLEDVILEKAEVLE